MPFEITKEIIESNHDDCDAFLSGKSHEEGKVPPNLMKWVVECYNNKKPMLDRLGFDMTEEIITIKPGEDSERAKKDVGDIIKEINKMIPLYLSHYGFTEDIFYQGVVKTSGYKFIPLTKHITYFFNDSERGSAGYNVREKCLNGLLCQYSKAMSNLIIEEKSFRVCMSMRPKGFIKLGTYKVDNESCFRQDGSNSMHKYIYAKDPTSFMIIIKKNKDESSVYGRMLGMLEFNEDGSIDIIVHNYYFDQNVVKKNEGVQIIHKMMESVLGIKLYLIMDEVDIEINDPCNGAKGSVYVNPVFRLFFSSVKDMPAPSVITREMTGLGYLYEKCADTGRTCNLRDTVIMGGEIYYFGSITNVDDRVCTLTGIPLWAKFYNDTGVSLLLDDFVQRLMKCQECDRLTTTGLCKWCAETSSLDECELCSEKSDNTVEIFNFDVCLSCIKKLRHKTLNHVYKMLIGKQNV